MFKLFTSTPFKKNKGFTLVELMVVSGIIIFMTALVLINYRPGSQQLALTRSAHKLAQDIRRIQEMAMSPREESLAAGTFRGSYGIRLHQSDPSEYRLFADCNDNQDYELGADEVLESIDFENGVEITDLFGTHLRIIFSPPDPTTTLKPSADSVWIELGISGQSKIIHVNKAGLIYVE